MTDGTATVPAAAPRSLLPQEHGAWGQLAMPLLAGLAASRPTLPGVLIAFATIAAFLAHEPWLVALGHRGVRARLVDGPRALRVMLGLAATAAVAGATGLLLAPPEVRLAALLPAALAALVVVMVLFERERTLPGELAVSSALAGAGALVALASGAPSRTAGVIFAVWSLSFATTVFAVKTVLLRTRARGERDLRLPHALATVAVAGGGSALALAAGLGGVVPLAVLPTAGVSLVVCIVRFAAARLRSLGWALVAATTASLVVLLLGLRAG